MTRTSTELKKKSKVSGDGNGNGNGEEAGVFVLTCRGGSSCLEEGPESWERV
jgi:hypothetical protein